MDEKLREEIGLDKNAIKELKQIVEHDTCSTLTHGVEVSDDIVVDLMEFFREHGYIKVSDIDMSDEERKLRDLLWATHPCDGKYCDDGEIQCNRFFPVIDFLRDKPEDIEAKIPLHNAQLLKLKREVG